MDQLLSMTGQLFPNGLQVPPRRRLVRADREFRAGPRVPAIAVANGNANGGVGASVATSRRLTVETGRRMTRGVPVPVPVLPGLVPNLFARATVGDATDGRRGVRIAISGGVGRIGIGTRIGWAADPGRTEGGAGTIARLRDRTTERGRETAVAVEDGIPRGETRTDGRTERDTPAAGINPRRRRGRRARREARRCTSRRRFIWFRDDAA